MAAASAGLADTNCSFQADSHNLPPRLDEISGPSSRHASGLRRPLSNTPNTETGPALGGAPEAYRTANCGLSPAQPKHATESIAADIRRQTTSMGCHVATRSLVGRGMSPPGRLFRRMQTGTFGPIAPLDAD